jgi:hypothetical protein
MARTGRPKQVLELTDAERDQLVRWERRRKSSQALALRSRIVLRCAEGHANQDVAAACGVSVPTVGKWRRRFCELRLDGLSDDPRPGRPASITAEQVEQVVVETLGCSGFSVGSTGCAGVDAAGSRATFGRRRGSQAQYDPGSEGAKMVGRSLSRGCALSAAVTPSVYDALRASPAGDHPDIRARRPCRLICGGSGPHPETAVNPRGEGFEGGVARRQNLADGILSCASSEKPGR